MKEKIKKIEEAIKKIGELNNSEIIKELSWSWNPFKENYRYFDIFNREYKANINRKGEIVVKVFPTKIEKLLNLNEGKKEYIISNNKIYRKTDEEIVSHFIIDFLKKRNYKILNEEKVIKRKNGKIFINLNGHEGEIEITKNIPYVEFYFKDSDPSKPFFCSLNHQYIFKVKNLIETGKEENILIDYQESEIGTTSFSLISLLRRAIYGFKSDNLRAFYSDEGLFPEVKHSIKQRVYGNIAGAIVGASVFVRVAEKLKGNTWYTLASGLLAFIRAPAEIYYMKKSLKLSENLPSTTIQKIFEKGKIKEIYESKEIRIWRNFERELFEILKTKENFLKLIEKYSELKFKIYKLVENGKKQEIIEILREEFNFNEGEIENINYFIENLEKIDTEKIVDVFKKEIGLLYEKKLLKSGSEFSVYKYIEEIFKGNLIRLPLNKAFKFLNDRIKQEEREPTEEEFSKLLNEVKKRITPFRFLDAFTFSSLFITGYLATFMKNLPDIFILIYYVFYGAMSNIIVAAVSRYGSQTGLQYLYRGLENAPTITSAADAWNEFNSHIMRLWAVFSSLGMGLAILGKLLSDKTFGISRYFVEALAVFFYISSLREWFLYYEKIEKKSKIEG